jgi:hypothetical protein
MEILWHSLTQIGFYLADGIITMLRKQIKVRDTIFMEIWLRNSTVESNSSNHD